MSRNKINIGVVGIGGYAESITNLVLESNDKLDTDFALIAVCDPALDQFTDRVKQLKQQGIQVSDNYDDLLNNPDIQAIWLPVPHHLHASFSIRALEAGKAVMCEKPAAGNLAEVDSMIDAETKTKLPLLIGFQEIYDPNTLLLKKRLLNNDFGKIQTVSCRASWPKKLSYYNRNQWAGKAVFNDHIINDSPVTNAMGHFANLCLFFAGPSPKQNATPLSVQGQTLRAHNIENFDTASITATTDTNIPITLLLTHAGDQLLNPVIMIHCDNAIITRTLEQITIEYKDSTPTETINLILRDRIPMLQGFADAIQNHPARDNQIWATLNIARKHVQLIELVSQLPITSVPNTLIAHTNKDTDRGTIIPNLMNIFEQAQLSQQRPESLLETIESAHN
ncbi:Gfo/Idh/MocA family oxidoreductase [Planctomycetota bacterium]|nr:Gfo/Idh/MocA family oxidoreductase [Planctomycetota bacterium]